MIPSPRAAALLLALGAPLSSPAADDHLLALWRFEKGAPGANAVTGGPEARIERALAAEGHAGDALAFEDWSIKDYLKPDPAVATRVTVPAGSPDAGLDLPFPFRVGAWIYPTADPIYYGGIVEKGHGFGGSFRLVLLRGLRVSASLGASHVTVRSPEPIALDAWHEVVLVADGKSLALQVDGEEVARADAARAGDIGTRDPLVIGERFTGRIDEVSIRRLAD